MDFYATEENPQMTATDFYSLPPAERAARLAEAQRIYWSLPEYASEFNGADPVQTQEYWQEMIAKANAEEDAAKAAAEGRWGDMAGHLWDVYGDTAFLLPGGKIADSFMGMLRWGLRPGWKGIQSGVRVAKPTSKGYTSYRPATDAELTANAARNFGTEQPFGSTQGRIITRPNPETGAIEYVRVSPSGNTTVVPKPNVSVPVEPSPANIPSYTSEVASVHPPILDAPTSLVRPPVSSQRFIPDDMVIDFNRGLIPRDAAGPVPYSRYGMTYDMPTNSWIEMQR